MPANEFEKQVQKQLDDFQLSPSASVWKNVEEQIRKKKRRRVIIFFIFSAALLLLGYYAYNLLQAGKTTGIVEQPVAPKNEKSITNDKNNIPAELKEQPVTDQPKEKGKQGSLAEQEVKEKKNNTPVVSNDFDISVNDPSGSRKNKSAKKKNDETIAIVKKEPVITNKDVESTQEITVTNNPPVKMPGEETVKVTDTKDDIVKNPPVAKNDQKDVAITKDVEPVKTDSVKADAVIPTEEKKDVVAKKKTSKFQVKWGLDLSAGATTTQNEVFSLLKSSSADLYLNNAGGLASSPVTNVPRGPLAVVSPSSIKPGAAFRVGAIGELKVSERSRVSAGLQYSYASNKIKTGSATDTSLQVQSNNNYSQVVDRVYRGSLQYNHTNSYHFLSIPLQYHWQINKSKKLPLQWNAGVSFNYLLATNTLLYSPSYGGIYYHDKNAITKMHFNLSTGLSVRLKGKNGMEWVLGPEMYLDTRKLIKDNRYAKQYMLFSGINAKLFFNKKKNK